MTITVKTLTPAEIQTATLLANQIAGAATRTVTSNQFVYFAAFDGTRNDRDNLPLSGLPLSTNAAQLEAQIFQANVGNPNVATGYFRGVGTNGVVDPTAAVPTSEVKARAEEAYTAFNAAASAWLAANPGGEVRAMLATFSRGGSVGATFSQILFERGIVDPDSQQVLIAPGTSLISGGVVMDTVNTGVGANAAFLGADNLVFTTSDNEYRYAFRGLDNSGQIGSAGVFNVFGNHVDNGGYDRGLGALVLGGADGLGGAVGYFNAKGLSVAATPSSRLFDPTKAVVHSEGKDSFGNIIWSEYGSIEAGTVRLFQNGVIAPVTQYNPNGGVQNSYLNVDGKLIVNLVEPGANGGTKSTFTIKNADTGQVLAQTEVETSADKNTQTIATYNTQTQTWTGITNVKTTFDDGSYLFSSSTPDGKIVLKSVDTDGQLAGTITDTPDGQGGINRTVNTTTDGQPVQLTQHASAAALANGEQPGDYTTTAITINGQSAVNATLIGNVIDATYASARDIIMARGTGEFTHIVEAGDATNANGTTASLVQVTGRTDWWNDPAIGNLASDTVGLISALRSGRPLPIATAGFNFASHNFSDPAVANIAFALSGISNLAGLVGALERGDLGRILIDGGGVARTALTIYGNSLTQQMISQYGNVFRAGELATQGNAAAAELYNANLGVDSLVKGLGQAIAVLNIINSLANGDIKGAFIGAVTLAFPVAGATIAAIDMAAANDSAWAKAA